MSYPLSAPGHFGTPSTPTPTSAQFIGYPGAGFPSPGTLQVSPTGGIESSGAYPMYATLATAGGYLTPHPGAGASYMTQNGLEPMYLSTGPALLNPFSSSGASAAYHQ